MSSIASAASCSARLVLPLPPGPVSVTSRGANQVAPPPRARARDRPAESVGSADSPGRASAAAGTLLAELEETQRRSQILESVRAEIAQCVPARAAGSCPRDNLAAVAGTHDPCRAVHVCTHVPLVGNIGLTRMNAHTNAHRPARRASWASRAAATASLARANRRRTHLLACRPRPAVSARTPRATRDDARQARPHTRSPSSSSRRVEPSMSVKSSVTVPLGSSRTSSRSHSHRSTTTSMGTSSLGSLD